MSARSLPAAIKRIVARVTVSITVVFALLFLLLTLLWRDRIPLNDIPVRVVQEEFINGPAVTVTWFGVTTLLFDDGETQILIDGFVSRPNLWQLLSGKPIDNDSAMINFFLNEYRIRRLAAIIPVHSHFDHAMDVGAIANRTSASILGSSSTAQIAAGANVPEDQIVVIADGAEYQFGQFTVMIIESNHAPIGWRGSVPLPGTIDSPLQMPAPFTAWREGSSYSLVISHPLGTTLVQGSGGIRDTALNDVDADFVMLGVSLLESLGRDYLEKYWQTTVTSTGAKTIIPIHFEDYTKPFGTIELVPRFLDDFSKTVGWLDELRRTWDTDSEILMPAFGVPIKLYPSELPEA
jgi:L-ascorbate metabolism protein UlaG (beta-lactamase superfamily)